MIRMPRKKTIGVIVGFCLVVVGMVVWASRHHGGVLPGISVEPYTVWVRCSRGNYVSAEIRGTSRDHARKLAVEMHPKCIVMSVAPARGDSQI